VTVNNASRAYGDPNPAFTGTITGLKNGDVITANYSTTATPLSPVGTYPITATLVDPNGVVGNYIVTINNGVLTVTPAALVVTANNAARLYGDPNPPFSGTIAGIKNGDNITAIYTTPATPLSPVGTYPIIPTVTDNGTGALSNYIVTANNGSLVVSQAPLTVTAANASRPYGQPNPVFTGTIAGIKNNDNITATYSTTATATSPAGTYPIVPAVSDNGTGVLANYTVTINNGTLTVTQAVLTVTAANASMVYGDPVPPLSGTIAGIVNGDNITATFSTVATSASPVGTYAIVPTLSDNGTGALANYSLVINNGVLTITPAPLAVTAANASMIYGDPLPALTGAIIGIKNGDNITATFGTTATSASPVGTYPIVPTLLDPTNKLGNYTVISNNGVLTINPAPLSVTAGNASRLFGTPNPPLSGIIAGIKNGDNITATYATTAVATSPVGSYPITPTLVDPAGKLGNYTVTSTNGTLTVNAAPTANFVFVNNQAASGNSISGYSVAVDGTLTSLASSPTLTGGLGANAACSSVNRLVLSAGNNLLFVSNGGDQTISAFQIDPTSGALTAVAGSPFASGLTLDACSGISLSATPDGRFLMASSNGQIKTFSIGAGGVLTSLSTAANSVTPNASMKISANGQFLAVSNKTSVSVYAINGDGSLTAVAGSPFAETGTASLAGLDFSSTSGLLFGTEASTTAAFADAWTVGTNGALAAIAGSPFSTTAINSNVVLLSPNDAFLFASNSGSASVSSFSVAGGSLTSLGSFGSSASLHAPVGMATDRSGSLLYVADDAFGVAVFRVDGAGSLAQLGDVAIAGAGQVQDLVAYPPRMASNADLSVTVSASSPNVVAGQNVTYTITVTNNGADPAAATVTDSLPSGFSVVSCTATGNGTCSGNSGAASFYLLQSGESQTATLVASTSLSIADGTVATNTVSISNSSAVDPNAANNSASVAVTVAQPAITTLTVAPASGTYGGSTTLSATLTIPAGPLAGKTVSFSLNGTSIGSAVTDATGLASVPASLVGIAAGSYPAGVTASFAGDPNNKASNGSAALTVNPAVLTVTAANATRLYGDPNPTFTFSFSGFVNGETAAVLTGSPSCTTTATAASPAGTYPISCTAGTLTAANYTFSFVGATLTVTPAPLTVTADNVSRVYGDPNPVFTGTITGIKNGDNITAVYATTATAASPAGTYAITPGLVDPNNKLSNYTVTSNVGTLTVTPAPLTVTAASATKVFGNANPPFSGTITGIKNGDNITATYASAATANSPVGTYPIVPTLVDPTNKLGNYTVTINNGTLTVTSAVLTVTANNASRLYGDPNPVFTGTITGIQNGDNITASFGSPADPTSPVGTYPIIPTLSDNGTGALANYTIVSNNGVLTVNQAPLTVTVASVSRLYGDANPAFSAAIVGIKNGDAITAAVSTTADPTSPVGTYPIVATLVDPTNKLSNYSVTINNGTLTITPAPLSVTAASESRLFGTPNPPLTGIISGVKNGDPISATYSTTAVATSPVGTYPITATLADPAGKLGNYTVTSTDGTLTINSAPTANFVFVNNQAASGNSIAGYSVAVDGTLTSLASSPTLTGGLGANAACSSVNRLALSAGNNLLFVSNGGDQTISAFQIDPTSGALTPAAGSPFASGLTLDACSGISLSATPDGRFLMASSNGQIKTFSIGAGGVLTSLSTAANSVTPNASMKISANGQFLAVSNKTSVSVYAINGDGSLTPVAGSPFAETGTGSLAGLDFSSTSGLLFGAEASTTAAFADAWTVGTNGALAAFAGSPFSTTAINSNVVLLSPNDAFLFASNSGSASVSSFSVAGGSLTSLGSFGSAASLHAPVGMATDRSGSLLYVADDAFGVAVFRVDGAGSLAQLGDVAIAGAGQVQDLVAYPPRMASNADLSVAVSASSPNVLGGENVTYTITVTNNGADPAAATVTDSLPSGFSIVSCTATGNGACIGNSAAANFYLLQSGESQTVTIVAQAGLSIPDGTTTTNTVSISNSSAVDPNNANNSANANVTVAQAAATTLAVAPASATYSASSVVLSATLSSSRGPVAGRTVSFTLNGSPVTSAVTDATGLASVSASLTGLGAGSYPVAASFAGDPNNTAASGSSTLTINPAVLTVTATDASSIYGDPNPTFAFTITGFVNGDTSAVLNGSPSCTSVDPTSAVGTYPITCAVGTLSAANYSFSFVNGTLTITPAALTVTANNASSVYGDPNPAFTGTITGIKNGDNITATYSTTATAASAVGTYPITSALVDPTSKLGNYTVTSNSATLTITPAPLSVVAANASRFYGDPNPTFTGTITGIKNGDNITATYSSVADPTSAPGTYPIVPALVDSTTKLGNYTVTSTNGVLTVNAAPLVVTAANASRLYGDPNPAFTGTISGVKNGDTFGLSFSTVATATSPVGTYPIVPALSDPNNKLSNYSVTLNNGTLTISPAPLTVTAANASRPYGSANPAFTGTITGIKNGDNITATYASATDATTNVGNYPIVPTLVDPTAKLGNYTVTPTNGTLTITQVPLTVTANNASRVYGDPNPAFTGTITGLVNGDNITFGATSADPTAAVGTYPIVPALVDPNGKLVNYTLTSNNGTLTVTPAPLSVTAANASRQYGDPNPAFTGTITGVKNGDNITATYSSAATATSAPGTYPIVPALVDPTNKLSNYTVTPTNGTLTVTPAVLIVSAANASMVYGDPVPALSGTITGIKNGDNITASYSTTATSTSAPGTYPITTAVSDNGTGALANYTLTVNNATLTISPAPLVVTATSVGRLYGDPNPAFTGTISGLKNGDNIGATFSAAADPTSPVGTYAIIPTLSDPASRLSNYSLTVNNGVLTVAPAPLSVVAASASRVYGDPNPAFTGTLTGVKNGDNITASFSSAATAASSVGTYPIVATLSDPAGKLSNYSVNSTNGTLTVTPAPLTAAATSTSRVYGHANPSFSGTISGLKNNDQISATFSSPADLTSAVGTYPILPTFTDPAGKLGNYTVNATGTLTVTPAPLSVTIVDASRLYGDPNPVFTGSINGIRNNDNITLAPTTTATPTSPVGTYAIVAGFNDPDGKIGNYAVTSNTATLTVTPAPLTIQANNATAPVGGPFPTFTGTITGLKNNDVITASYSTTATTASPAGTYPITPSPDPNPLNSNYNITLVNGTLTLQ
jgi:6-phosphogluconolactonase (cycloisomerase 2 family)